MFCPLNIVVFVKLKNKEKKIIIYAFGNCFQKSFFLEHSTY
jgi:hypothetical protein